MNQLGLTESHVKKLLEMTVKLFPEYKDCSLRQVGGNGNYILLENKPGPAYVNIHWFEFCMTYLVEKLSYLLDEWEEMPKYVQNVYPDTNGKWNLYTKFHFHYPKDIFRKHPVDYLYEQFLKLKD